ncbi:dCTP deaminase [Mesorhizobium sp.]|uniref:dCTP deaminase n=1 Tax=Mesorhizobium sp. TaxID=1871066 RepID=UPI0025C4DAF2|nr:dCTP deaminase [Mesorhizobium sp.]
MLEGKPVSPMMSTKHKGHGVSWGLSEAGYDIRIKQEVVLHPFRRFSIASAIEKFHMPNSLVGIVHDKSSWARRGLSVFNTVIEPGWEGYLTLELVYHGWRPLRIPAGAGIAQVIFHEVAELVAYTGKYQGQEDRPVAAIAS